MGPLRVVELNSTFEADPSLAATKLAPPVSVLFGSSPAAQEVVRNLSVIAATDLSVLLQGEPGTGMEQVARWLHGLSPFSSGGFLTVSAFTADPLPEHPLSPLPSGLLTQLQYAKHVTLFVENVETLEPQTQAALARLIQDVASDAPDDTSGPGLELRIIATTQKDPKTEVANGTLRPDFFHCISAFTARMLPLRSRLDELPDLVEHFVQVHASELGLPHQSVSREGLNALQQYTWPGNLRELEEMLIGYVLTRSEPMLLEKVAALQRSSPNGGTLSVVPEAGVEAGEGNIRQLDDDTILKALRENGWNRRQTASRLKISYRSLLYKLKKMDLASGHRRAAV